jgi:hypothetical protein
MGQFLFVELLMFTTVIVTVLVGVIEITKVSGSSVRMVVALGNVSSVQFTLIYLTYVSSGCVAVASSVLGPKVSISTSVKVDCSPNVSVTVVGAGIEVQSFSSKGKTSIQLG